MNKLLKFYWKKEQQMLTLMLIVFFFFSFFSLSHFSFSFSFSLFFYEKGGLLTAAFRGHGQIVEILLEKGKANVDTADEVYY